MFMTTPCHLPEMTAKVNWVNSLIHSPNHSHDDQLLIPIAAEKRYQTHTTSFHFVLTHCLTELSYCLTEFLHTHCLCPWSAKWTPTGSSVAMTSTTRATSSSCLPTCPSWHAGPRDGASTIAVARARLLQANVSGVYFATSWKNYSNYNNGDDNDNDNYKK